MSSDHDIAVIGLGALFPGAGSVDAYWQNIASGHDAIADASPQRLDRRFLDPDATAVDRLATVRGGFVPDEMPFDAGAFGIMPVTLAGSEPDQLFTLAVAARCLEDAGYLHRGLDRSRTAVILGRGGYLTPGMVRLGRKAREGEQLIGILRSLLPEVDEADLQRVKAAFSEASGSYGPDTAIGLVPNLAASRVANRLDLQGPAYTVDAACASALIAVEHAVRELRSGRCELVLAGGVHLTQDVTFWSVFTQLGALSRTGMIRPLDQRADGLLIGEGIGILALKRLEHARRDDDRIYAVLKGTGSASDGRAATVMVPRVDGQVLAMARAWADAGLDPASVGLVEAHGTGTPAGDAAEVETLARVFGAADGQGPLEGRAGIGSVKSMIGHTMPAAGAAGLIKAVLAAYHGVLPPTLHCDQPREQLSQTRFAPITAAQPWSGERIAAVNAFGFGGINAHVVLAAHGEPVQPRRPSRAVTDRHDAEILALAAADPQALLAALDAGRRRGGEGPCRLALVDPTPDRLARARKIVARGRPWTGRGGIWFRDGGLLLGGGRLAFVFPGIEVDFSPEIHSVAHRFGLSAPELPRNSDDVERTGIGVVSLGRFLDRVLTGACGVQPDLYAGHSVGEWTAMIASGVVPGAEVDAFLDRLPRGQLQVPGVLFAAAGCGVELANEVIADLGPEIAVSHDNCPKQVVLCGQQREIELARQRLVERGVFCQILPFRSGFHSPLFSDYVEPHRGYAASLGFGPARVPLLSATTVAPYPEDADGVRSLIIDHLVQPLRFRELIVELYERGARVFVQPGQGSVPGFISDTLQGADHLAITASDPRRSGLTQLRSVLLALFVEGAGVDPWLAASGSDTRVPVSLVTPLITVDTPLRQGVAAPAPDVGLDDDDPLRAALAEASAALTRGPAEVVAALRRTRRPTRWEHTRRLSVDDVPALIDHSFFPQASGWSVVSDLDPVVPMTMTLATLCEAAARTRPGSVAVAVEDLRAMRWLRVEPAVEVQIVVACDPHDPDVRVAEVVGYASARIRLADAWPTAPAPQLPELAAPRPPPQTAAQMYAERWMFHGPAYQGVVELTAIDEGGLDGGIEVLPAPGALMDAAGQLVGYWLLATQPIDQLALPVGVASIRWFAPAPPAGTRLSCRLRVVALRPAEIVADLELLVDGRLWCRIDRWTDHRFTSDVEMCRVMRLPEHSYLARIEGPVACFDEHARRAPSRDWLMRRYLNAAERAAMLAAGPRRQRAFLNDRIAAKDAVRALLEAEGTALVFPAQIELVDLPSDPHQLAVRSPFGDDLRVAVDRGEHVSAAVARRGPVALALAAPGEAPDALARRATSALLQRPLQDHAVVQERTQLRVSLDEAGAEALVQLQPIGDHLVAWTTP